MNAPLTVIVAIPFLVLSPLVQFPARAGDVRPIADFSVERTQVSFEPLVEYQQVRVTVTGPDGFEAIATFDAGQTPAVELPGTDGLYKYELRFSPVLDREEGELLAAARKLDIEIGADKAAESMVQSGFFSLADGGLVPADLPEPTRKVVLTAADGVIRNSLCVGFDCPNAPVFDDSTILLMENNTRIKFGDTSNAPFPNNDWEIEANSSLSGGPSYLGFNDCGSADNDGGCADDLVFAVESGARPSALYVESDGDIGIGTSNPVLDLHIVTGNTPALRLDQDGSSGFTPQVWDIAGNETNFFVRDVTAGSRLPLRIRPGAPTSSIDVAQTGNVGLGTTVPQAPLHLVRAGPVQLRLDNTASGVAWNLNSSAPGDFRIAVAGAAGTTMALTTTGNMTVSGNYFSATCTAPGSPCAPDYVFEDDYALLSLDDLAEFIRVNKHLPNVPSEQDLRQAQTLNMNEFQMTLLEKIEELTLYTLQQERTIRELSRRLDESEKIAQVDRPHAGRQLVK